MTINSLSLSLSTLKEGSLSYFYRHSDHNQRRCLVFICRDGGQKERPGRFAKREDGRGQGWWEFLVSLTNGNYSWLEFLSLLFNDNKKGKKKRKKPVMKYIVCQE